MMDASERVRELEAEVATLKGHIAALNQIVEAYRSMLVPTVPTLPAFPVVNPFDNVGHGGGCACQKCVPITYGSTANTAQPQWAVNGYPINFATVAGKNT